MKFICTTACFALAACSAGMDDEIEELAKGMANLPTTSAMNRDQTIAGPDRNGNGIRDDIDEYIGALSDTPKQKAAMSQQAAAIRRALTADIKSEVALMGAARKLSEARSCLTARYESGEAAQRWKEIQRYVVNTPPRLDVYTGFLKAVKQKTYGQTTGEGCQD